MGLNTYRVDIAGTALKIKSSHDRETVDQIIELVEDKIDSKLMSTGSATNATTLACLRLAEELFLLKSNTNKELSRLESLATSIIASDEEDSLTTEN